MSFKGSLNSGRVENHLFTTKDKLLVALGFGSFSKNNCYTIYLKTIPALMVAFPGINNNSSLPPFAEGKTILDLSNVSGSYDAFNKVTKRYYEVSISLSKIYELIDYHEKRQQGRIDAVFFNDRQIKEIQNSLSGSVRINFPLNAIIPNQPGTALMELYFQKKANRDSSRKMTSIGPPMLTATGKTPAGTPYAAAGTREHQSASSQNTGSFLPPAEGDSKNPYNSTTAPLKLHYNSTEKVFEAGTTQMLAILLTDVAAADISRVKPPSNGTVARNSDYYDPDGRYYNGSFTTGIAMPVQSMNGNPHMFGPNIIECQDKKVEKVRCINRSPKAYEAGEQVMLNNINGEWIITSLGEATLKQKSVNIQDWAFCKMIVNSDSFFKDSRYYINDNFEDYSRNITSSTYESKCRAQFYYGNNYLTYRESLSDIESSFGPSGLALEIAYLNYDTRKSVDGKSNPNYVGDGQTSPIQLSNRYIQTTVFDIMHEKYGGFIPNNVYRSQSPPTTITENGEEKIVNEGKILDKVNVFDESFDSFSTMADIFPFWGPVFTDGYNVISASTNGLYGSGNTVSSFYKERNPKYFSKHTDIDITDLDTKNFPAEATSKIIDIVYDFNSVANLGTKSSNTVRNSIIYPPYYRSSTVSTKHVQFVPLTDNLAAHTDRATQLITRFGKDRHFYDQTYGPNGLITNLDGLDLHGNIPERNPFFNLSEQSLVRDNEACLLSNYGITNIQFNTTWNHPVIPYDCFIKRPPTKVALGAPRHFRDSEPYIGANCVGIIAGMCRISKPGGGDINFEVKQHVGLVAETQATSEDFSTISNVGQLFGVLFGFRSGGIVYDNPQWGSSDDGIDSFGTTALHVRIFDEWPEQDTFYDPRYFSVLHFNPIPAGYTDTFGSFARYDGAGLSDSEINEKYQDPKNLYLQAYGFNVPKSVGKNYISYEERPRSIDRVDTVVDIRVPTLDTAALLTTRTLQNINKEDVGIPLQPGERIDRYTALRPENEWRVNPIRRGQFLTGGGFLYRYSVIGLNINSAKFVSAGTGFFENSQIECDKGVVVYIKRVSDEGNGQIAEFEFSKESTIPYFINAGVREASNGEGFVSSDFASSETELGTIESIDGDQVLTRCYKLIIPSPDPNGEPAVMEFTEGLVWSKTGYDAPPKEHVPKTRISVGSKRGQIGRTADLSVQQSVSLSLDSNDTGQYRLFTFFHNDITHTPATDKALAPNFLQYIDLNIV